MGIRLLDPEVVGKIAAGEVVERPASVVKELVENALDAGARSVRVEIETGGCDLIRIADDGEGISRDDLALAVQRHATSKIATAEDLGRIGTLGFRGEALASISAVSELTLVSRQAASPAAYQLRVVGGVPGPIEPAARAVGTTVTVERLFFNLPARRKFFRSVAAEAGQVVGLLGQIALGYPGVSFELVSDGRRVLRTSGSGDLRDAVLSVLGREVADALLPVEATVEADRPARVAAARISGYVAEPGVSRSTRSAVWLFVNHRLVRSRSLSYAVEEGFSTLLRVGRHPVAVLNLDVPPAEVDVNVHPSKIEVRLLRERLIYGGLRDAVRAAVSASGGWAREVAPSAPTAPAGEGEWGSSRLIDAPVHVPGSEAVLAGGRKLPILRVIGQVAQTYIVAEGEGGVYLIDQHAAHERVLLERLTRAMGAEGNTQLMLEPVSVDLSPVEWQVLTDSSDILENLGYRLEPFGGTSVLVRGVPTELAGGRAVEALKEALAELGEDVPAADRRERVAISLSCRGAVKAGQVLAPEEMRALVMALEEMDITQHCSHGRPTAILLSRTQLEREFGRR